MENLFYATFDACYTDFKEGKSKIKPKKIEGTDFLWFDIDKDKNESQFWKHYVATFSEVMLMQKQKYLAEKYGHLKNKAYEIKFYMLNDFSVLDSLSKNNEKKNLKGPIESFCNLSATAKSNYYDLYLKLENIWTIAIFNLKQMTLLFSADVMLLVFV